MTVRPVQIIYNGTPREIGDKMTVAQLLESLELRRDQVAVEVNYELVPQAKHAEHPLHAGDQLEVVSLVGGG
jgi:sulfur carrier protein